MCNYTTSNQLAEATVLENHQPFRRTKKVLMTQCPKKDIFTEIKMTFRSAKCRNLEPPDAFKLCLKRKKSIFFREGTYLFRTVFGNI